MRKLSITVLVAAILAGVIFAACYTRTVHGLLQGGLETSSSNFLRVCFDLRDDIQVVAWRAFPQASAWAHDGVSLFRYGDAPEGTKAVFYFPSWYLLIPLSAILFYAAFDIYRCSKRRVA
jgi:hypothetical protein